MAGCISGKEYWRVCYWRLPKHFPLLLRAERGTFCCTVVHQACFFHFPLICYCAPRSSIVLRAVLLGPLSAAFLIAGNFLFLAHSGSLFLNVCAVNTGLHILVRACVGFFPSAGVGGLYSAYLYAWMCFLYNHPKHNFTHRCESYCASEQPFGHYYKATTAMER